MEAEFYNCYKQLLIAREKIKQRDINLRIKQLRIEELENKQDILLNQLKIKHSELELQMKDKRLQELKLELDILKLKNK